MLTPGRYRECPLGHKCREDWKKCENAEYCKTMTKAWKWPPYEKTSEGLVVKFKLPKSTSKEEVIKSLAEAGWAEAEPNPTYNLIEDIRLWRDLCEELYFKHSGYAYPSDLGYECHPAWELFGNSQIAQSKRNWLWEKHQINFIYYRSSRGHCLVKDWRSRLEKLESIYGVEPNTKYALQYAADKKQTKKIENLLDQSKSISNELDLSYELLETWRNLCEWLDRQWYKFAYIYEIESALEKRELKIMSFAYTAEGGKVRSLLYLNYQIQFISYRLLPVVNYWGKRRLEDEFGEEVFYKRGWCLVSDWEFKIDFLEQLILLRRAEKDIPKIWLPRLKKRISNRKAREKQLEEERINPELRRLRLEQEAKEKREKEKQRRLIKYLNGNCGWCDAPVIPLMLDCPSCQKSYES